MLQTDAVRFIVLVPLFFTACRCDDTPPPVRAAEKPRERVHEELEAPMPAPDGTPIDSNVLAKTLPATLGDAAPEGEPRAENMPLSNGGTTSSATRTYVKGEARITVQVSDMQHAPLLRQAITNAKQRIEAGKRSSWKTAKVHGHDVVVQHLEAQHIAIANVIVTDRLFVNVRVEPAESADTAIEWAGKMIYEPITKLQAPLTEQGQPSQPPPM